MDIPWISIDKIKKIVNRLIIFSILLKNGVIFKYLMKIDQKLVIRKLKLEIII